MSDEDHMLITGSITLTPPVPLTAIEMEHNRLLDSSLVTPTYTGTGTVPALAAVAFTDEGAWLNTDIWFGVLYTLEAIARRHSRTLTSTASFDSDTRGRGHLLVDAGGHVHLDADSDDADSHRTRTCLYCLHCYPSDTDSAFEVIKVTENDGVCLAETPAGPFTDFAVHCDEHGETACLPSRREALFRREQHLLEQHTPHPLPLGPVAARDVVGHEVLEGLAQAARLLRVARYYIREGRGGGAVTPYTAARASARRALAALPRLDPEQLTELLVQLLVEEGADR